MKTKIYSMYGKAVDANGAEHIVTVVGQFEQTKEYTENVEPLCWVDDNNKPRSGVMVYPIRKLKRTLKLGYSICHPNDTFNKEEGIRIAQSRIKHGNYIGEVSSNNCTMLNDDSNNMLVFSELNYITKNIDKYLPIED